MKEPREGYGRTRVSGAYREHETPREVQTTAVNTNHAVGVGHHSFQKDTVSASKGAGIAAAGDTVVIL